MSETVENNTDQELSYRDHIINDPDGIELLEKAILEAFAEFPAISGLVKNKAQGFELLTTVNLANIIANAGQVAKNLLPNVDLLSVLNDALSGSDNAAALQDKLKQGLAQSLAGASLPALAQMAQYATAPKDKPDTSDSADIIERLGGEGGGEEPADEGTTEGDEEDGTASDGDEPAGSIPGGGVTLPDSAKDDAMADQGMVDLSGNDSDKKKKALAQFAQKKQAEQLEDDDEEEKGQQGQEGQDISQAAQVGELRRQKQASQQGQGQVLQNRQRMQAIQQAEKESLADSGGGEEAIMGEALQKSESGKLSMKAVEKAGERVGANIKARMKNGDFTGFWIALILALCKDGIDWIAGSSDLGIVATLASIFLGGALTMILLGEGTYFKRLLIKKTLGKIIIGIIAEVIPGFSLFPTYTIGILIMKSNSDKEMKKQKKHYNKAAQQVQAVQESLKRIGKPQ